MKSLELLDRVQQNLPRAAHARSDFRLGQSQKTASLLRFYNMKLALGKFTARMLASSQYKGIEVV
jgi:hypothetical protein